MTTLANPGFATRNSTPAVNDVQAALTFIVPQDTKPYFKSAALTGGPPEIFFQSAEHTVTIRDMRPLAGHLSLERQGFELHPHETSVADLYDDEEVSTVHDREIEALLKRVMGAQRVLVFDRTRRSDGTGGAINPDGLRGPAERLHVDYTVASGPQRAADVMGADEVRRVLDTGGRIAQVNIWRPITGPVQRSPLALADAASIAAPQLVATEQLFPDRVGEIYQVAFHPRQVWFWAPAMERGEVLLIKGWDSLDDGRARFTPHGAFQLPGAAPDAPPRESIEVRAFLVFEGR